MSRASFSFSHRLRVRWAEVDKQNIVFNGHYLTYFDVGVTEYWRAIGLPYPETSAASSSESSGIRRSARSATRRSCPWTPGAR